jgi:hypothetical protein
MDGKTSLSSVGSMSESGGPLSSMLDRFRNGQGPRYQFGEILGGLAARGSRMGRSSNEPHEPEVAHQADRASSADYRYTCFTLGLKLDDTLRHINHESKDFLEQAYNEKFLATPHTFLATPYTLRNYVNELKEDIWYAAETCQFESNNTGRIPGLILEMKKLVSFDTMELGDVLALRRRLDELNARIAWLAHKQYR